MILILCKATAVLFTGAAIMLLVRVLIMYLSPLLSKTAALPWRVPSYTALVRTLREDPGSPRSRKIRGAFAVLVFAAALPAGGNVVFALLIAAIGYSSVAWYFNVKKKKALALFDDQLVEALGAITNSVRAGQSLRQALENTVRDTKPPLSDHLSDALIQADLGLPLDEALLTMTRKVPSKDLRIAVLSMNLSRETGGNLGEILTRLSETMRERKKIQGKINALTAQGKGSAMVMSGLPFLLLGILYLMEPDLVGLMFSTLAGNIMLAAAACMIGTAIIVINKIVEIDI